MQNDDKRTSRDDETFPHEAEADAAHEDELTSPEAPLETAAEPKDDAAKTISFATTAHMAGQSPLEPTFGMPDFDFPDESKTSARDAEEEAEHAMLAAKETLDLPLESGTGWESVGSIERPESLRGRRRRDDAAEATLSGFGDASSTSAQRSQATVMPFPGGGFSRSNEPTPVDMLRGSSANSNMLDDFASGAEEQAEPTPEFDAAAEDTLADAVQSALRNVYGGQASERIDDSPEQGGYTVADTLMAGASARERGGEALWPEANPGWQQPDGNEDYVENERERGTVEANTEAVLDYLYGQRRADKRETTVLSADSSLRDFGEAAGYSRDWQDPQDFDDRHASQASLRDLGGIYRGGQQQRYVEQGDRAFLREQEMAYRPVMPGGNDANWGQPSYLAHPPAHLSGQTYPAHLPSAAPDSLSAGSPDSGHLLGAAGLGLIGGIALAGVLAVFVFNSFVDENDPTATDTTPKVVERLAAPSADSAPPVRIEVPVPARTASPQPAAAVPVARPAAPAETPRQAALPQPQAELPGQKLAARDASGAGDGPIKLDIRVADASDKEESLISLKGLPAEARLSTGIDVGGGQWLLPPARLKDLTVTLPKGTTGEFGLEVQLLKDDAQTSLSDPVSFDLRVAPKRQEGAVAVPSSTAAAPEQASRLAVLPDETPQIETDFLTQMLIRDGNRLMRDGDIASARRLYEQAATNGNAEAALAMGRSYDPSYFEKLPVKTGKPDPATAFEWYKKALEGGLVTARVKIDALKQWLQR